MRQYPVRELREATSIWRVIAQESPALACGGCHGDDAIQWEVDGKDYFMSGRRCDFYTLFTNWGPACLHAWQLHSWWWTSWCGRRSWGKLLSIVGCSIYDDDINAHVFAASSISMFRLLSSLWICSAPAWCLDPACFAVPSRDIPSNQTFIARQARRIWWNVTSKWSQRHLYRNALDCATCHGHFECRRMDLDVSTIELSYTPKWCYNWPYHLTQKNSLI